MIPEWKKILRRNFTSASALADYLQLSEEQRKAIATIAHFPLNMPLRLAQKVEKGRLDDPILLQFLPLHQERLRLAHFTEDPVGDQASRCGNKLLHKYSGRALILCTSACAMHCRYCFRQHFDYASQKSFIEELKLIGEDPSIQEVILSGGDPLSLDDATLSALLEALAAIPHVRRIRFHTRFPIGIPERLTDAFCSMLQQMAPLPIWFVIHSNHPRELDQEVLDALTRLRYAGVILLNQAVLLKGVNDSLQTLQGLSEQLINHGITPYYLHQLDQVAGSMHFEVSEEQGRALIQALHEQLPGYGVPRYVKEIAGEPNKTTLFFQKEE